VYRKGWRYYRDSTLLWALFFSMLAACAYALQHPLFWSVAILLWMIRSPFRYAFSFAHPFRQINWPRKTQLDFREVEFASPDGLTLFGRFAPGRNRGVIILIHGLGGVGTDMIVHAEFLSRAGYGVFLIDLRAHGSSDGDTSTFGYREGGDVAGAVDYLLKRVDVDGGKIGTLGISLGAQAALRGALKTKDIKALVLEGLGPVILSDHGGTPKSLIRWINYPFNWMNYLVYQFMIGGRDRGVLEVIGEVAPRPIFLIASGAKDIYFNRLFYQNAKEPKELWELPHGKHGAGFLENSQEYAKRVVEFFDETLHIK
jgi:pimeloyl-ACP methyl ester carboxylesterase